MKCENNECKSDDCKGCECCEHLEVLDLEVEGYEGTPLTYTEDEINMPLHHALREFIQTLKEKTTVDLDANTMELITITFMAGASIALYTSVHGINGALYPSDSVATDNDDEDAADEDTENSFVSLKKSFSVMELLNEANLVVYPDDEEDVDEEFEMKNDGSDES